MRSSDSHDSPTSPASRRAFLKRSGGLALAASASPLALNLAAMGQAAAAQATDYKALVCVSLIGGIDQTSTVVPYDDTQYAKYAAIRAGSGGAFTKAALSATRLDPVRPLAAGFQYALAPTMPDLHGLFKARRAAILLNVGPLVVPLTRKQYESRNPTLYPVPPQLFSHNDQQSVWQSSGAEGTSVGWGGRFGDLMLSENDEAMFTCISLTGNAVMLTGRDALQYQCTPFGAVPIQAVHAGTGFDWPQAQRDAIHRLITQPSPHVLANEYSRVTSRALALYDRVRDGFANVSLATPFPAGNWLATQLRGVASLIGARATLGARRQVFMVSLDGFDLHNGLVARQPPLLGQLSGAITAFDAALRELGVADQVTLFTISDFGRSLTMNGNGSDHGWGSHQFIVGGAVNGGHFYGTPPPLSVSDTDAEHDQWHVGQGRLLPTTSVHQYAATLARWFGVSAAALPDVLPGIHRFGGSLGSIPYPVDLGFLPNA